MIIFFTKITINDPLINSWIIRENSRLKCCGVLFGRTQCVPTGGTGVLCQSFGLLIGMCYVLSRGLRHLPNVCRPYGAIWKTHAVRPYNYQL